MTEREKVTHDLPEGLEMGLVGARQPRSPK